MSESCHAISPPQVEIFKLKCNLIDKDILSGSARHPQHTKLILSVHIFQAEFFFMLNGQNGL